MRQIQNIVILAAGDSDRFWPFSDKYLFPFVGDALLTHLFNRSKSYAKQVFVVTAPSKREEVIKLVGKKGKVITQGTIGTGMAAAVISCEGIIHGETVILNASDFFDFEVLKEYIKIVETEKPDYLFLAKQTEEYFPGAYAIFVQGIVTGFIEKPDPENCPSNTVKLVADYFKDIDIFIQTLKTSDCTPKKDDHYERGINSLLDKKIKVSHILYKGDWQVIKYPWQILSMMKLFLRQNTNFHIAKTAFISKNALLIGPVHLGERVKIGDNCKIVGPTFIDDDTIIGDGTLIRESHIGKNCLIGSFTEVARSYVQNNVSLHRNYVGDSILGNNVLMGAGAVTANFRFDQQEIRSCIKGKKIETGMFKLGACVGNGAKIGVNTTLLPGIKIGKETYISPGEVVTQDVSDDVFVSKGKKLPKR